MQRLVLTSFGVLIGALAVSACLNRDTQPINPCIQSGVTQSVRITSVEKIDLLFLVDNSGSMAEEQQSLRDEIPEMVRVLATGDIDNDGTKDFPPVRDLRVAVITSSLGAGGVNTGVTACNRVGDDALLQTQPAASQARPV